MVAISATTSVGWAQGMHWSQTPHYSPIIVMEFYTPIIPRPNTQTRSPIYIHLSDLQGRKS